MKVTLRPILRTDLDTKGEEKRIDLKVRCQGRQTKLPTQYYARPADWDKEKRRIKSTSAYAIAANRYLRETLSDFEELVIKRTIEGMADRITLDEIRALLSGDTSADEVPKRDNAPIEEIFDLYVDFLKTIDKRSNTIRNYGTNKRVICGFARERYGQLVTIKNINLGFVRELRKYLKNDRKNENGTIEKRLEGLRATVRYAIHEGYAIDDPFNRYNNLIPAGGHKTIFLDADEYKRFKGLFNECSEEQKRRFIETKCRIMALQGDDCIQTGENEYMSALEADYWKNKLRTVLGVSPDANKKIAIVEFFACHSKAYKDIPRKLFDNDRGLLHTQEFRNDADFLRMLNLQKRNS